MEGERGTTRPFRASLSLFLSLLAPGATPFAAPPARLPWTPTRLRRALLQPRAPLERNARALCGCCPRAAGAGDALCEGPPALRLPLQTHTPPSTQQPPRGQGPCFSRAGLPLSTNLPNRFPAIAFLSINRVSHLRVHASTIHGWMTHSLLRAGLLHLPTTPRTL